MRKLLTALVALAAAVAIVAVPAGAITNGVPGRERASVRRRVALLRSGRGRLALHRSRRLVLLHRDAGVADRRPHRRSLHLRRRRGRSGDDTERRGRRRRRLGQLRRGTGLQHPPAELDLRSRRKPAAVRGVERGIECGSGLASWNRSPASRLRPGRVLPPRRGRGRAREAGEHARRTARQLRSVHWTRS